MNNNITMLAAALTASLSTNLLAKPQETRPNILLIMTDQQTASALSSAGNPYVHTPNMDRLADKGVTFTNAYCTAPLSGPSRSAMFTGCYPDEIGVIRNGTALPDSLTNRTLGTLLSESGYDCAYGGKWHVGEVAMPDNMKYGFKKIYGHSDIGLAESSIDYLREEHKKPFFLVVAYDNPHNICEWAREQNLPYGNITPPVIDSCPALPPNFEKNLDEADVLIMEKQNNYPAYPTIRYTKEDWRRYLSVYYTLVEKVDKEIGKIIDELDRQNLWDNTLIIFTSDHGDGVAAHSWNQKSALYEEVVNVPFIVSYKGVGHKKSKQLISTGIDLFATICDYAKVEKPQYTKGKSIKNALLLDKPIHNFIVTETTFDNGKTRGWMLRTPQFKYVLYSMGKNREQLFDINQDKLEQHNLAKNPNYKSVIQHHRDLLYHWMKDNNVRQTRGTICDVPTKAKF